MTVNVSATVNINGKVSHTISIATPDIVRSDKDELDKVVARLLADARAGYGGPDAVVTLTDVKVRGLHEPVAAPTPTPPQAA